MGRAAVDRVQTGRASAGRGPRGRQDGSGFTLIEVLVVIAIIGVLVGLLMPALQSAREAARAAHCANNLKQIGVALAHYESAAERYPPGVITNWPYKGANGKPDESGFYSWTSFLHMILPQLDEQIFYDGIRGPRFPLPGLQNSGTATAENKKNFARVDGVGLPPLVCPSDTQAPATWRAATFGDIRLAKSNYLCFFSGTTTGDGLVKKHKDYLIAWPIRPRQLPNQPAGTAAPDFDRRAIFGYGLGTSVKMIKDGTANTIAVTEYLKGVSEFDGRGAFWWTDTGMQFLKAMNGPNSSVPDQLNGIRVSAENDPADWGCFGDYGSPKTLNNQAQLNLPCSPSANPGAALEGLFSTNDEFASARSRHRGGVYALYADGHVQFVDDNVTSSPVAPYGTWQRLIWIDDGRQIE